MKNKKQMILLVLCGLMPVLARAQHKQITARLDSLYKEIASKEMLNGNVLVAKDGKIVYRRSFGYADFASKSLNNVSTGFQLASLSKVFTAISILQLSERGRLKLDDYLSHYFPAFPYKNITIRQLLSHSSGLSDQDLDAAITGFEKNSGRKPNNNDLIPLLAAANIKLKLSPGQKWWYCNLGYELLATLVEYTTQMPFDRYLDKYILKPAGMKNTYLKMPGGPARPEKANNYDYETRYAAQKVRVDLDKADYTEMTFGHSNIVSTCEDLFKLDQALYKEVLLKQKTLAIAFSPDKLKDGSDNTVWLNIGGMGPALDGLGWFMFSNLDMRQTVWHAGGMQGAVTIMLRDITHKNTVIMLDNAGSEGIYKTALNALHILNEKALVQNKRNLSRIYGQEMIKGGADHAMVVLQTLRADTANYNLNENDMNNLGYALISGKKLTEGLETLKVNCLLYPESDNVYNSYAEALAGVGRKDDAIALYRRSLELNPKNEGSQQALNELLK